MKLKYPMKDQEDRRPSHLIGSPVGLQFRFRSLSHRGGLVEPFPPSLAAKPSVRRPTRRGTVLRTVRRVAAAGRLGVCFGCTPVHRRRVRGPLCAHVLAPRLEAAAEGALLAGAELRVVHRAHRADRGRGGEGRHGGEGFPPAGAAGAAGRRLRRVSWLVGVRQAVAVLLFLLQLECGTTLGCAPKAHNSACKFDGRD